MDFKALTVMQMLMQNEQKGKNKENGEVISKQGLCCMTNCDLADY